MDILVHREENPRKGWSKEREYGKKRKKKNPRKQRHQQLLMEKLTSMMSKNSFK